MDKEGTPTLVAQSHNAYFVEGFNWWVRVEVPKDADEKAEKIEAATCGVAKFMYGEANIVVKGEDAKIGFLCGVWRESGDKLPPNYTLINSVILLANAGFFKQSAEIQKEIYAEVKEAQARGEIPTEEEIQAEVNKELLQEAKLQKEIEKKAKTPKTLKTPKPPKLPKKKE